MSGRLWLYSIHVLLHICLVTFISFISYIKVHFIYFAIHFYLIHFVDFRPSHPHLPYWSSGWNLTFQCTILLGLAIIHLRETPNSKATHVKHNCGSLCNIVKEWITKTLICQWDTGINIRPSSFIHFSMKKYAEIWNMN